MDEPTATMKVDRFATICTHCHRGTPIRNESYTHHTIAIGYDVAAGASPEGCGARWVGFCTDYLGSMGREILEDMQYMRPDLECIDNWDVLDEN